MQPSLSYLYAVPVVGVADTDGSYSIKLEGGAVITVYGENVDADVTGLTFLTSFNPSPDRTLMRFGRTVKQEAGYLIQDETDIEINSVNYTITDPRWPDAGEYAPEAVVDVSEPDPAVEQWNADRTQEGPENPS